MTITITIELPDVGADGSPVDKTELLAQHLDALGFVRKLNPFGQDWTAKEERGALVAKIREQIYGDLGDSDGGSNASEPTIVTNTARASEPDGLRHQPRKRGEPSPGRKRRTKEEIAEDEAAAKYEALNGGEQEDRAQISTGEERVGPEDDPETAALDAADEAAEVEAARDPQNPLTLDDLRKVVGEYNKKVGLAVSAKQIPSILGCKMIEVPETQEALAEAIAKVQAALDTANVGLRPGEHTAKVYTATDVQEAMKAYAAAYGEPATIEDRQKINVKALGPTPPGTKNLKGDVIDYWPVSAMPADKLGDVVRYWTAAVAENPFKREHV